MLTKFVIVLDKSGSMWATKREAINGLNEQIQQARIMAKDHEISCSFYTFNADVFEHLVDVAASELKEIDEKDFIPNGGTAMKDAMGYVLTSLFEKDNENTKYLVYVISDGETYDDKYFDSARLGKLIENFDATKRLTLTYMGCKSTMEKVSREMHIPIGNMAAWSNDSCQNVNAAFTAQTRNFIGYFQEAAKGNSNSRCYASCDGSFADYTESKPKTLDDTHTPILKKQRVDNILNDGHIVDNYSVFEK